MDKRPLIGVVAPVIAKEHIANIIRGIVRQAGECRCDVMILSPLCSFNFFSSGQSEAEREIYDLIRSEEFSGFIYIKENPAMGEAVIEHIEQLLRESNRYVMAVDEDEDSVFDSTQYDDYYDFSKVVEHLVQVHDYKKIYCLTGPENSFQAQSRLRAYMDVMHKYGLHYDGSYYSYGTFWVDSSQELARRLICGELSMPEAIVCGNDIMAMSLIKCLQGAGIKVPEDVAVTGYDGFPFSANIDVTLTTYARDHFQLGADAMRRLMRDITGKLYGKISRPDSGFIIGSSCGCQNIPAHQLRNGIPGSKPAMWQAEIMCDDLCYDLSLAEDTDDLLRRALRHTNTLYCAKRVGIYLSDSSPDIIRLRASANWNEGTVTDEEMPFSKMEVSRFMSRDSGDCSAVFISLLHHGAQQFGYITIEFGDANFVYDSYFMNYVSALNVELRRLMTDISPRSSRVSREKAPGGRKSSERYSSLCRLRSRLKSQPEKYTSIELICAEMNMSRSTLQKNYREYFGTTVFDELIAFRVEKAKKLLSETNTPINRISALCGYSSESYFMKQFKKLTGMTPTEYRAGKSAI